MASKCPNCGAENPENAYYCGWCAASLREEPPVEEPTQEMISQVAALTQTAVVRSAVLKVHRTTLIWSGLMALLTAPSLFDEDKDVYVLKASFFLFLSLFFIGLYYLRTGVADKYLRFIRHRDFVGKLLAETKGYNAVLAPQGLAAVLVTLAFEMMLGVDWSDPVSLVLYAALPVIFAALFGAIILRSRITIEPAGICTGNPNGPMRPFIPFESIEHIAVSNRMLTVRLNRQSPWNIFTRRLIVRGDVAPLASVLKRELPPSKLSIEGSIDTISVTTPTQTCPQCGEEYLVSENACPKCGTEIPSTGYLYVSGNLSQRPIYAGIALIVAAFFLALTGFIFIVMEDAIVDVYGSSPGIFGFCGSIEWLLAVIALFGGLSAMARRHYGMARAGAAAAIIGIGGLVSLVLGFAALFWLKKSSDEFEKSS
ncbi:MAG: zinc-ribbon domain-containing protein [Thermoplasmatota archaeon]